MVRDPGAGSAGKTSSINCSAQNARDLTDFMDELVEFSRQNRLRAVGERMVGIVVYFDEQAVGPGCHSSARKRQHFVPAAGSVRGIHDDGQMAAALHGGYDAEVQRVSCVIGEGADTSLAQDHVIVSLRH
jgi:hypothetical protein